MSIASREDAVTSCRRWIEGVLLQGPMRLVDLLEAAAEEGYTKPIFFRAKGKIHVEHTYTIDGYATLNLVSPRNGKVAPPAPATIPFEEHWIDFSRPRAQVMTIAPEMARRLLDNHNFANRPLSQARVSSLAEELGAGRWKVNGETIIVGSDGVLKDGQHRLAACVKAGVPLETWVVFGADPGCFDTIDRGRVRTAKDDFAILGEANCHNLQATVALLYYYEQGRIGHANVRNSGGMSSQELQDVLSRHPSIREHVSWASANSLRSMMAPSVAGFLRYVFWGLDPEAAEKFFDDLKTGADLGPGDPVLILRNRLINDRSPARERHKKAAVMALAIKAWNHRRDGNMNVKILPYRSEDAFPVIR